MTIRSKLHEMKCCGSKKPVAKKKVDESCTTMPGDKAVVWHEGVRYMFRNGMWATPRGYVWPNTELCHILDQTYEEFTKSGKTYWPEDQQGVGIPQTVAGGRQFSGNVEDRPQTFKVGPSAKEGTPNTGATSPNESTDADGKSVAEGGRGPYSRLPWRAWGALTNADGTPNGGYERRLMDLFTRATYDGANAKPMTSESVDAVDEAKAKSMDRAGVYMSLGHPFDADIYGARDGYGADAKRIHSVHVHSKSLMFHRAVQTHLEGLGFKKRDPSKWDTVADSHYEKEHTPEELAKNNPSKTLWKTLLPSFNKIYKEATKNRIRESIELGEAAGEKPDPKHPLYKFGHALGSVTRAKWNLEDAGEDGPEGVAQARRELKSAFATLDKTRIAARRHLGMPDTGPEDDHAMVSAHPQGIHGHKAGHPPTHWGESVEVYEAGRPKSLIGSRIYHGRKSNRVRIRDATGAWHWASKNRV